MFHCNQWSRRLAYAQGYAHGHHKQSFHQPFHESRRGHRGGFGVRRPLRYLSHHLDLDDTQRRKIAASFERIKLEREQAKLDLKKSDGHVADEFLRDDVSVDDFNRALEARSKVEDAMRAVIAKELFDIAQVLDPEQRDEFAHLMRTGVIKF